MITIKKVEVGLDFADFKNKVLSKIQEPIAEGTLELHNIHTERISDDLFLILDVIVKVISVDVKMRHFIDAEPEIKRREVSATVELIPWLDGETIKTTFFDTDDPKLNILTKAQFELNIEHFIESTFKK